MPTRNAKRVDLRDVNADLAKAVLDAAETLAGKPMKLRGPADAQYFIAPSRELANICRRWLASNQTVPLA